MSVRTKNVCIPAVTHASKFFTKPIPYQRGSHTLVLTKHIPFQRIQKMHLNMCSMPARTHEVSQHLLINTSYVSEDTKCLSKFVDRTHPELGMTQTVP
jgi:hypothetical protein